MWNATEFTRPYSRNWWYGIENDADAGGRVCMTVAQYHELLNGQRVPKPQQHVVQLDEVVHPSVRPPCVRRDMQVLHDPLYPALNRTTLDNFGSVMRNFNLPTQSEGDTYRLLGYLKNDGSDIPTWKLFGRQRDRNRGEYYIVPADRRHDLKLQITDNMVVGRDRLRDLDTIPNTLMFASPMLERTPYTFVELPKTDFLSGYV